MHVNDCLFFEKFKFNDCLLTQTKWCWLYVEMWCQMTAAFDREMIKCIDEIVCDQNCCIRCWNHRVHWRNCLMSKKLYSISNDQMHWRNCLFCCLLLNDKADKLLTRSKYRFVVFDRFISLTWLLNLIKRNVDSYKTFK